MVHVICQAEMLLVAVVSPVHFETHGLAWLGARGAMAIDTDYCTH
jgi:hypothetical protein